VGYAATGEVSEEVFAILHGVGANGKTTLVNAIMETLGDYAKQAAPYLLLVKRSSHPIQLANLFGARFVASDETDEGRRLAEGLVKQVTGRDPIRACRMQLNVRSRECPAPQFWREFPGGLVLDGRDRVA
jgi:putative DNA primase/helicase